MKILYDPKTDSKYQKPFIDIEEQRFRVLFDQSKLEYTYIHGGFENTDVKFSFCFPAKEKYEERFFHFLSPFPGPDEELGSLKLTGSDDKIAFAITNGGYFVESNMGSKEMFGQNPEPQNLYKSSAAVAEYSRVVASRLYGIHHPYGYVYGGSGGGYKTISCIENTKAWDGAVPYVIGSPVAMPSCHTSRAHARRVLRNVLPQIVDHLDAGSSVSMYAGLNDEETQALREITLLGMPPKAWFWYQEMDDGALPVLAETVKMADPEYFKDFWEVEGYLGADKTNSINTDRIKLKTTVTSVICNTETVQELGGNGVDDAFLKMMKDGTGFGIEINDYIDTNDFYNYGVELHICSGKAAGSKVSVSKITDNLVILGNIYGNINIDELINSIKPGDVVEIDNSDYLAIQSYHRHIVPESEYVGWNQYRDDNGEPIYPQRNDFLSRNFALGASGALQEGTIQGKVIVVASAADESAYPWQADWYKRKVESVSEQPLEQHFRLWFAENSLHDDSESTANELFFTPYTGMLRQALVDLSKWVESGIEPQPSTNYELIDNQIVSNPDVNKRGGLQPDIHLTANNQFNCVSGVNKDIEFKAEIKTPNNSSTVTKVEWCTAECGEFVEAEFNIDNDKTTALINHKFKNLGIHFVVVRVSSNCNIDKDDCFKQIKNIARVRVTIK